LPSTAIATARDEDDQGIASFDLLSPLAAVDARDHPRHRRRDLLGVLTGELGVHGEQLAAVIRLIRQGHGELPLSGGDLAVGLLTCLVEVVLCGFHVANGRTDLGHVLIALRARRIGAQLGVLAVGRAAQALRGKRLGTLLLQFGDLERRLGGDQHLTLGA